MRRYASDRAAHQRAFFYTVSGLILTLLACSALDPQVSTSGFVDEAQECTDPLMEMVRWRDDLNSDLIFGKRTLTAVQVADAERERVYATVEQLRPLYATCKMTWNIGLFNEPKSPADRLREETVMILLDRPARAFPPETLGQAGRPVRDVALPSP
jgi:hypothetical protein